MVTTGTIKKTIFVAVVLTSLVFVSCNGSKSKEQAVSGAALISDSLFKSGHDVRLFDFGMAREEFDLGDDSTVLENEKDHIVEIVNTRAADSVFAECSYRFENDLFQSSEITIFSPNDSVHKMVTDSIVKTITGIFGKAVESRGYFTWKTRSKKGYLMEIFLGDLSFELGNALQIQFFADLIEKPMLAELKR